MKRVLLFGGASETHRLLAEAADLPLKLTVSVTREYGRRALPPESAKLQVLTGALDKEQILGLLERESFCAVIDATHPYAVTASANISAAAEESDLPCLRLLRQASDTQGRVMVDNIAEAVAAVNKIPGPVLLTTGSKDLRLYGGISDFQKRVYVRVLPVPESLSLCQEMGIALKHIIAMQGPFSALMNEAIIKEFGIRALVTKDSGLEGGFPEKVRAAQETGCELIVLRRPQEKGLTLEEILNQLNTLIGE